MLLQERIHTSTTSGLTNLLIYTCGGIQPGRVEPVSPIELTTSRKLSLNPFFIVRSWRLAARRGVTGLANSRHSASLLRNLVALSQFLSFCGGGRLIKCFARPVTCIASSFFHRHFKWPYRRRFTLTNLQSRGPKLPAVSWFGCWKLRLVFWWVNFS